MRLLPPLVLAGVLVAGCGGPDPTPAAVHDRVGAVVVAANAGDTARARTALAALRSDVQDAQRLGALSAERAAELTRLADEVEAGLPRAAAPSPTPSPTRANEPTPAPTKDDDKDDGKSGDGKKGDGKKGKGG